MTTLMPFPKSFIRPFIFFFILAFHTFFFSSFILSLHFLLCFSVLIFLLHPPPPQRSSSIRHPSFPPCIMHNYLIRPPLSYYLYLHPSLTTVRSVASEHSVFALVFLCLRYLIFFLFLFYLRPCCPIVFTPITTPTNCCYVMSITCFIIFVDSL